MASPTPTNPISRWTYEQPNPRYYEFWHEDKLAEAWTCSRDVECSRGATTIGTPPLAAIGFGGRMSVGEELNEIIYSSREVSYKWGFDGCKVAGIDAAVVTKLRVNGVEFPFSDDVATCPTVTRNILHSGAFTLGPEFIVYLFVTAPFRGSRPQESTIYLRNFVLDLKPLEPNSINTTSSASSTVLVTSLASTSSSDSTGSSSASRTFTNSIATGLSTSFVSSPMQSQTSNPGDSSNQNGDPSGGQATQRNLSSIVGGTIGGIALAIMLFFFIWRARRRYPTDGDKYQVDSLYPDASANRTNWPHDRAYVIPPEPIFDSGGIIYAGNQKRLRSALPATTDAQEALVEGAFYSRTSFNGFVHEASAEDVVSQGRPPELPSNPRAASPSTTIGGLPAYDTYMDAPLVTFRSGVIPQDVDESYVEDPLHQWAERHREFVPAHLERRLRSGGYAPESDPDELDAETWLSRFGVTRYELAGLRELYRR